MKRLIVLLAVASLLTLMAASVDKVMAQDPLEHFQCYKAKGEKLNIVVSLADQIISDPKVKVIKPAFICAPVNKNNEGFVTTLGENGKHLVCYKISKTEKVEGIAGVTPLNPVFPPATLEVGKAKLLCVPVDKDFFSRGDG